MPRVRFVLPALLLFAGFGSLAFAAPPASCGSLNAGLQILSNVSGAAGGSNYGGALKMAVWYPTSAAASAYTYVGPGPDVKGTVALNGAPASCAQFPLIVFSHGWSGCGTQSVYLTEQLARLGYIVAAPDHNDHGCSVDGTSIGLLQVNFEFPFAKFGNAAAWTDQTGSYRNVDVETVLNYMLNTWSGKASVNPAQIVMSGHSFGGYTVFAKIGGWASWLDSRFKAAVMYSPYIQAFQAQNTNTISTPGVPQLYMTGGPQDKGIMPWIIGPQPCDTPVNTANCGQPGAFEQVQALKYYGELPGAGYEASHFAFTNSLCTNSGFTTVASCLASVPNAQAVVNYTVDFLEHFTAGQTPQRLWSTGPEWATWWQTAGVPSGSYLAGKGGAQGEILSLLGEHLTTDAPPTPDGALVMPQQVGRTTVTVTDSQGSSRPASLYYVSPGQVNLVIPNGTVAGQAVVKVELGGTLVSSGPVTIKAAAPALFTLPGNVLAGWAQGSGGRYISIWAPSGAVPLNVSDSGTYLIALGTGLRTSASTLTATVGSFSFDGVRGPRPALGASPDYQGLDQVAIGPLPASLSGSGVINVVISTGTQQTNTVRIAIQ